MTQTSDTGCVAAAGPEGMRQGSMPRPPAGGAGVSVPDPLGCTPLLRSSLPGSSPMARDADLRAALPHRAGIAFLALVARPRLEAAFNNGDHICQNEKL